MFGYKCYNLATDLAQNSTACMWPNSNSQRVFNVLQRNRLSGRRMIWLLPPPFPPLSSQQVVSLSRSSCVSPVELTGGGGENQIIRQRESLVLYNPLTTLWYRKTTFSTRYVNQSVFFVFQPAGREAIQGHSSSLVASLW